MKRLLASFVVFVTLTGIWSASLAQEKLPSCDPPPEKPKEPPKK